MLIVKKSFMITTLCLNDSELIERKISKFNAIINGLKTQKICTVKDLYVDKPDIDYFSKTFSDGNPVEYAYISWYCSCDQESYNKLLLFWGDYDKSHDVFYIRMPNVIMHDKWIESLP